jgi:hypothetical protein
VNILLSDLGIIHTDKLKDLFSNKIYTVDNNVLIIEVEPFSVLWLEAEN